MTRFSGWGHSPQVFDELKASQWKRQLDNSHSADLHRNSEDLQQWAKKYFSHYTSLKSLLAGEAWARAEASTLNSHYTSREVIEHGLWAIARRLGFKGGRVLETSAGIGHVLGLAPPDIAVRSHFTACELDSTAGRMLAKLYPQATVHVCGFQDARIPPESQDLVIGNFPFNKEGWSSGQYPFSLHNQFFARSIDLLIPGGLIVAITSDSTMDAPTSATFRKWMEQRANLIGAIRLPNNTFKKNAGTEVTTDILIFRKKDARPICGSETFTETASMLTGKTVDGRAETVEVNEYFHRHPDMMLGRMSREGTMYEPDRPALIPHEGIELLPQLHEAVAKLPAGIALERPVERSVNERVSLLARPDDKEGSYQIRGGRVYQIRDRYLHWID